MQPSAPREHDLEALAAQNARVHSLALAIARDAHVADDLAQDAWVALLRHRPEGSRGLSGWLAKTMRNLLRHSARDEAHRRDRELAAAQLREDFGSDLALERVELHRAILEAVCELKEPYRTTVLLRWFEELEPAEIARRTGVPVRTVHTRVSRALAMLRRKLGPRWGSGGPLAEFVAWLGGVQAPAWKGTLAMQTKTKVALAATVLGLVAIVAPILVLRHSSSAQDESATSGALVAAQPPFSSPDLAKSETINLSVPHIDVPARAVVATPKMSESAPELPTQQGTVAVLVRDKNTGAPLGDVKLCLRPRIGEGFECEETEASTAAPNQCPRTDGNGNATFAVPLGIDYVVSTIFSESCGLAEQPVPAFSAPGRIEMVLEPLTDNDLTFCGRVVAEESGAAIMDVRASALRSELWMPDGHPAESDGAIESTADSNGYFELQVPSWKPMHAKVEAPGRSQVLVKISTGHENREHAVEVMLSRAATVDVLVLGKGDTPLKDVSVRLSTPSYEIDNTNEMTGSLILGDILWSSVTEADGRSTIDGLPPEVPLSLEYHLPGQFTRKQATPLVLKAGERQEITFRQGEGGTVAGWTVERDGSPVPGTRVWMLPGNGNPTRYLESYEEHEARVAVSDERGHFEFEDVSNGGWLVGPSPKGPYAPRGEVVHVVEGVADRELFLATHSGLFIRGTVTDSRGAPVQGVWVETRSANNWPAHSDRTSDAEGHFAVGPLVEGTYLVSTTAPSGLCPGEPLQVQAGSENVQVQLLPGAVIRGLFMDAATGAPLRGTIIVSKTASERQEGQNVHMGCFSDAEGRFEIGGIAAGTYDLAGSAQGVVAIARGIHAAVNEETPEVSMRGQPGARVSIRYEGSEDYASYVLLVDDVEVAWDGLRKGIEDVRVVPAGILRVECRWPGHEAPEVKELTLALGEQGSVVLGKQE